MLRVLERTNQFSKTLILGDGEVGRLTRVYLHEQGIEVSGFIVSGIPTKDTLMDVPVKCIESIDNLDNSLVLVCVHKKWWNEVINRLLSLGVEDFELINDNRQKYMWNNVTFKDLYGDVEEGRNINTLLYHRVAELDTVYSLNVQCSMFNVQCSM